MIRRFINNSFINIAIFVPSSITFHNIGPFIPGVLILALLRL